MLHRPYMFWNFKFKWSIFYTRLWCHFVTARPWPSLFHV